MEKFLCDHVLIPSNNQQGSKTKKELRSGNIRSESTEFIVGSDSIVTYTHSLSPSLTQTDSIIAYASLSSKLQKWLDSYISLYLFYQAELFPDIKLNALPCLNILP